MFDNFSEPRAEVAEQSNRSRREKEKEEISKGVQGYKYSRGHGLIAKRREPVSPSVEISQRAI